MKMTSRLIAILLFVVSFSAHSQVGINSTGADPDNSAMLDVSSTEKGILIPRMTEAQRIAIALPAMGLMVFQTDGTKGFYYYETSWKFVGGNSQWTTSGSDIYYNTGKVGIGATSVTNKLEIAASENEGITIGKPYDVMGSDGGSYNLKFYGYSDNYISSIAAKITADRIDRWGGEWKRQGTSLGFYTTAEITGSYGDFSIERMRITDDGNVGIGKSLPATLLDVNGVITATGGNSTTWNTAYSWGNHAGLYRPSSWVPSWTDVTNKPSFATVATSGSYNDLSDKPTILNSQWATSGSDIYYNAGNVGVGTSSVTNKLEVAASESEGITIGKPNDDMGLNGGSYSIKFYGYRDIVPNAISAKITADRTDAGSGLLSQGTSLGFYTSFTLGIPNADNSSERMRITDGGYVGIGTSSPSTLLEVNGVITATGGNSTTWNTAYSWGNHAGLYRSSSWVPSWTDVTGKPTFATVATSGSYNDLSDKPTILNSQWATSGSDIYYNAGNVGIGTSSPAAAAALEINSTTKGFLPPCMTQAQRDALTPVAGLQIFNTTTHAPNYYNGLNWCYFDGTPTDPTFPGIGTYYQGGIVAYIFQPGDIGYGVLHGLIAAPWDQSSGIQWFNGAYSPTYASATGIGSGNTNTNTIVSSQGPGSYAAILCSDLTLNGYSDWYLPSIDELYKLYLNRLAIGGFSSSFESFYWSSSELGNYDARYVNFENGVNNFVQKNYSAGHVRAIRTF